MYAGGGSTHAGVSVTGPSSSASAATGGSSASGTSAAAGGSGATHAFSNALAEANDLDALVFEFGTSRCKLGFAGEDFPRVYESALPHSSDESDAARRAARFELDAEQQAQWLFDATAARLHTRVSDHPLLLVERPFALPDDAAPLPDASAHESALVAGASASPSANPSVSSKKQHLKMREQMVEVLMEQLGSPALFCAKSAVLTCYANARTSGLVVEMGATYTSVTSVHEGYAFAPPKTQVHAFGGFDLDAFLRAKLAPQLAATSAAATSLTAEITRRTPTSWSVAVEAKESGLCRVADSAFDEAQNAQLPLITYELPDKTVVAMGTERFSVPEQYFRSAATTSSGSRSPPDGSAATTSVVKELETERVVHARGGIALPEFVCEVGGMTTEAELRKELFQNIVLTGGSSCFENLPTRLEREVVAALGAYQLPLSSGGAGGFLGGNLRVKVVAAHAAERKIGAFLGGSILASLGSFHEMWLSKAEYAEHGATLIHKKCP